MVASICGCRPEEFLKVAEALCRNSGRERTSSIVYAVGWTQHTTGVQMIRAAGILQLLLGNIGRPGGGIMAMRGHASIQGSTDVSTLYNTLPGYLPQPSSLRHHETLRRAQSMSATTAPQPFSSTATMSPPLHPPLGLIAAGFTPSEMDN